MKLRSKSVHHEGAKMHLSICNMVAQAIRKIKCEQVQLVVYPRGLPPSERLASGTAMKGKLYSPS